MEYVKDVEDIKNVEDIEMSKGRDAFHGIPSF